LQTTEVTGKKLRGEETETESAEVAKKTINSCSKKLTYAAKALVEDQEDAYSEKKRCNSWSK